MGHLHDCLVQPYIIHQVSQVSWNLGMICASDRGLHKIGPPFILCFSKKSHCFQGAEKWAFLELVLTSRLIDTCPRLQCSTNFWVYDSLCPRKRRKPGTFHHILRSLVAHIEGNKTLRRKYILSPSGNKLSLCCIIESSRQQQTDFCSLQVRPKRNRRYDHTHNAQSVHEGRLAVIQRYA